MRPYKVLFVCSKTPYPPVEGSSIASYNIISSLAALGVQVKVISISTPKMPVVPEQIPDSFLKLTGFRHAFIDTTPRFINALLNLFSGESYHLTRFYDASFVSLLEEVLKEDRYDFIQFESLFAAPYLDTVRSLTDAPVVLRAHNIEHVIWQRVAACERNPLKRFYLKLQARRLKKYELSIVNRFDGIAAITPEDADGFRAEACVRPLEVVPFGTTFQDNESFDAGREIPSLFFIGSLNWIPNTDGLRWFIRDVWPVVVQRFPLLKFYVAGRNCPAWLRELHVENLVVLGEVPDAYAFMTSKQVMVVPLFSGSGMRVKIVEGMWACNTIVSTTIGAEGICYTNETDILIADTAEAFIKAIEYCISHPEACEIIGRNAQTLVKGHYTAEAVAEKLLAFYDTLLK